MRERVGMRGAGETPNRLFRLPADCRDLPAESVDPGTRVDDPSLL